MTDIPDIEIKRPKPTVRTKRVPRPGPASQIAKEPPMRAVDHVQGNETTRQFIERVLREYLTGRADIITETVEEWVDRLKLPWWVPSYVVKRAFRWAVPDQIIALVVGLLARAGLE